MLSSCYTYTYQPTLLGLFSFQEPSPQVSENIRKTTVLGVRNDYGSPPSCSEADPKGLSGYQLAAALGNSANSSSLIFFICINWCCLQKLLEGLNKITNVETFCKLLTCAFSKEFNHTCYASFFFYLIVKYHTLEMYNVLWHIKEFEK